MTFRIPAADGLALKLSAEGLRLIKSFEGYHTKLPDGRCTAYRCPAGVWTIGYGCTEGIKPGMVWTEQEALAALDRELDKFEAAVNHLVTVSINQNEFDALVSFAYNCGEGALARSQILKRLNREDRVGAASAFASWNKGGGRVLKGLVSRRAREASLFLKPSHAPSAPEMPQAIARPTPVKDALKVGVPVAAGGGAIIETAQQIPVPAVPDAITESVSNFDSWRSIGETLWTFTTSQPLFAAVLIVVLAGFVLLGHRKGAA